MNNPRKQLSTNDKAPEFTVDASLNGEEIQLSLNAILDRGPAVLYFYPSAYTKGCDIEANAFSEHIGAFDQADATVIGLSADSIERLNQFSADPEFCAGNFPVASDPEGALAKEYGLEVSSFPQDFTDVNDDAVSHALIPRITFVINPNGNIEAVFSSDRDDISPAEHVTESLNVVKSL